MYFIGFGLGSVIWLRVTDLIGRKWLIVAGHISHVIIVSLVLIVRTEWNLFMFLGLIGLQVAMTAHCAYLLLL